MKKFIFTIILAISMVLTSSLAAIASDEVSYEVSGHLNSGDYIVISSAGVNSNITIFDSDTNFEGYLFSSAVQKQALQKANIRSGPGMKFNIIRSLSTGDIVNVIGEFNGIDCEWSWYLLEDGTYVSAHLLTDVGSVAVIDEGYYSFEVSLFAGSIQKKALQKANIRSGPGMKFNIIRSLSTGDPVNVIGVCDGIDCDWRWYLLDDGTYVSAHLIGDV